MDVKNLLEQLRKFKKPLWKSLSSNVSDKYLCAVLETGQQYLIGGTPQESHEELYDKLINNIYESTNNLVFISQYGYDVPYKIYKWIYSGKGDFDSNGEWVIYKEKN